MVRFWVGYFFGDGGRPAFLLSGVVICWCRIIGLLREGKERGGYIECYFFFGEEVGL